MMYIIINTESCSMYLYICGATPSVESPWNQWKKSMESVDKVHGHCPAGVLERKHWTISSDTMENVHGVFPVCPWNFSSMSMELFHGIHGLFPQSMEIVQGISGQNPWTMSMEKFHGQCPWNLSRYTVDKIHGHCPLIYSRWLCSVNPEKTFESYCFHAHYGKMHLWLTPTASLVDSCY